MPVTDMGILFLRYLRLLCLYCCQGGPPPLTLLLCCVHPPLLLPRWRAVAHLGSRGGGWAKSLHRKFHTIQELIWTTKAGCPIQAVLWLEWDNSTRKSRRLLWVGPVTRVSPSAVKSG